MHQFEAVIKIKSLMDEKLKNDKHLNEYYRKSYKDSIKGLQNF